MLSTSTLFILGISIVSAAMHTEDRSLGHLSDMLSGHLPTAMSSFGSSNRYLQEREKARREAQNELDREKEKIRRDRISRARREIEHLDIERRYKDRRDAERRNNGRR